MKPESQPGKARHFAARWIFPVSGKPVENSYISILGNTIAHIGSLSSPNAPEELSEYTTGKKTPDTLITPGLINAHTHLEQSYAEVIPVHNFKTGEAEPFTQWLEQVSKQLKSTATTKQIRCEAGVDEILATGTTCVNDIASDCDSMHSLSKRGVRSIVSLEVFHPGYEPVHIDHWVSRYHIMQQTSHQLDNRDIITLGLSPHSLYNVSPSAWKTLVKTVQPSIIHTHLAEFKDECFYLQGQAKTGIHTLHQQLLGKQFTPEKTADSPVQLFQQSGLSDMGYPLIFAHAVETDTKDRQILSETGAGIIHCPRSNMALHRKTLDWNDWQHNNIPVGLGTDGRLSTKTLDLREEARTAMFLHGWTAQQALQAMTLDSARAIHQSHHIGSLDIGKKADLTIWKPSSWVDTGHNVSMDTLLEKTSPEFWVLEPETTVLEVLVNGQTVYKSTSKPDSVTT